MPPKQFFVYILANRNRRLYTGVTCDLARRMWQHRNGVIPGFTRRYNVSRLVYFEVTENSRAAVVRERQIKGWLRCRKIELIESANPGWNDLSQEWWDSRRSDPSLRSG